MGLCYGNRMKQNDQNLKGPIKKRDYFENEVLIKDKNNFIIQETISDLLYNSIARIEIKEENIISTGFFIKININKKRYNFLLTCHHSISQENVDSKIIIYIYFGKPKEEKEINIELDINKRYIKCLKKLDATIIEILNEDNIPKDKYLFPDLNYIDGFSQYKDKIVYTCGYPNVQTYQGERHLSSGIIEEIDEDDIFSHTCDTRKGSSGSPLINNDKRVIGIHFGSDKEGKFNYGNFIGKIIDEINLNISKTEEEKINILNINKKKEEGNNNTKIHKSKTKINKEKEEEKKITYINNNKKELKKNKDEIVTNFEIKNNLNQNNINKEVPNTSQDLSNFLLKMYGIEGIDPKFIGQIYQNPILVNLMKNAVSNSKFMQELNNIPEIKELKDKNPLFKFSLENPELIKQNLNPFNINLLSNIFLGAGNNNISNNNSKQGNKNEELYIGNKVPQNENFNKNNDDYYKYKESLIKLKEMGFNDDNLNLELLKECEGDFEKTLNALTELEK